MEFSKYIHAVGTGPKSNKDLSFEEAKDMMTQILKQGPYSEQIAAFLLGWRLKPETIEEFKGAIAACDEMIKFQKIENSIELGYPFDGKRRNPYIFPIVAQFLEKEGINLVVYGDKLQPAKGGITTKEVVENINTPKNVKFFDRKEYLKELSDLTEIRMRLGLRTAFNTIEKLPGVSQSEVAITGVFHKPYVKKYAEIFGEKYRRFALVQGNEGTPELFSKGHMWVVEDGEISEYVIDPHVFDINYVKSWDNISLEESIDQLKNPNEEFIKLAKFNAAVYLFLMGKSKSIEEAFETL